MGDVLDVGYGAYSGDSMMMWLGVAGLSLSAATVFTFGATAGLDAGVTATKAAARAAKSSAKTAKLSSDLAEERSQLAARRAAQYGDDALAAARAGDDAGVEAARRGLDASNGLTHLASGSETGARGLVQVVAQVEGRAATDAGRVGATWLRARTYGKLATESELGVAGARQAATTFTRVGPGTQQVIEALAKVEAAGIGLGSTALLLQQLYDANTPGMEQAIEAAKRGHRNNLQGWDLERQVAADEYHLKDGVQYKTVDQNVRGELREFECNGRVYRKADGERSYRYEIDGVKERVSDGKKVLIEVKNHTRPLSLDVDTKLQLCKLALVAVGRYLADPEEKVHLLVMHGASQRLLAFAKLLRIKVMDYSTGEWLNRW